MDALVIVPTYNERENIAQLVPGLLDIDGLRILIVDDGSPDGTGAVADELARAHGDRIEVMHRTGRRGLGRSYVDGMSRALQSGATVICQMDADLSHEPRYLPAMIAATADYDVVIGSRYLSGVSVVNWPLSRLILSVLANRYVTAVLRFGVHDCTSGFRAWRRDTLAHMPLDRIASEGYAFVVETLFEAARRGARIGEVPIIFVERRHGVSKLSLRILLESLAMPWWLVTRRFLQRAPAPVPPAPAGRDV